MYFEIRKYSRAVRRMERVIREADLNNVRGS
ncbi:MAG: hypothetical protein Hyperionvirus14_3 [Hyperionvirus sp.]|uniref:Uncharacterized protein n=1 Tax=Hyperionvirus sp. TaxID=2487770 RepID=A0A3G5ABE0_9VIRU|nr:MAG: hypothetical protein Hyperionvirus14_3 [Hyperionvirus sp.]